MRLLTSIFLLILFLSCFTKSSNENNESKAVIVLFFIENQNKQVLEKANSLLQTNLPSNKKVIIKLMRIGAFTELGMADSAQQNLKLLDSLAIQKDKHLSFWYHTINGLVLFRSNNYPQSYISLSKAIADSYDDRAKALSLRLLARIHYTTGDTNKATEWLAQSTDLFKKAGLGKSAAINHKILGRYYASKNEFAKATERFEMAKAGLEAANDSIELFYIQINLIAMKIMQGKYNEAKILADKNAAYINDKTDRQALALLYNNQGEIEYMLQNYDSCRYYYLKTLNLPMGYITDILRRGNACIGISLAFMAEKKEPQALQYAQLALQISKMSDISQLQYDANRNIAGLYQKMGHNDKAYYYLSQATPYLEKLGKKSVENSETVYRATVNLLKSESETQEMKGEKRFYLFLIIAGVVFTLFLLIYSLTTYRLMISRNQVLKSLVKKNLQLIDDERKLNQAYQAQLNSKKINRKSTDEEKEIQLYNELTNWLINEKQFIRKELTSEIVARELGTNREYLSRALSTQQVHFNELINKFRIEEAVKIFSNKCDSRNKYNINVIAADVGFKSMSVFIEAFRKQTGMNPAQFRDTVCSEGGGEVNLKI